MHELVDLGHSMTHAVVGFCRDETRASEHIGMSPAEKGWTVANDNEMYLVAALSCNVLQHKLPCLQACVVSESHPTPSISAVAITEPQCMKSLEKLPAKCSRCAIQPPPHACAGGPPPAG
jgi:hypothetical protein